VNITSYRVSGGPNYTLPGSEPFWSQINWTEVPLAASVSPGGGHTPEVLVKSANNGFDVYMLFRWNDSSGPSFLADTELFYAPNGTLLPFGPANTSTVKQLYYNSSYYYPDRVAMLWFIGNQSNRQQSPVMQLGSNGAITGGAAEIWHWQTNPTDSNSSDSGFPGGYMNSANVTIYPPDNLSFAEDDYTNTSAFFVIGGTIAGAPNLDPNADPFIVNVGNLYNYTSKTWTVEMMRSFTTQDSQYRVQLATGSSYFVAFAVWQGKLGESSDFKSVSQWYNLTVSAQAIASRTTTTTGGISLPLASAVAVSVLIVGLVIGSVIRSPAKRAESVKP
jgi:cytochrome b558/566 subunit A